MRGLRSRCGVDIVVGSVFFCGREMKRKLTGVVVARKRGLSCVLSDTDETKAGRSCPLVCSSPTLSEHHSACSATHKKLMRDEGWEGARLGPIAGLEGFFRERYHAIFVSLFFVFVPR